MTPAMTLPVLVEGKNSMASGGRVPCQLDTPTLSPAGGRRVLALLRKLDRAGGSADASDGPDDLLRAYYDDRGNATDTFNRAFDAKLIRVTHDCDSSTSTAYITDAGRAAIAKATSSPAQVPGDRSREDHSKAEASQS